MNRMLFSKQPENLLTIPAEMYFSYASNSILQRIKIETKFPFDWCNTQFSPKQELLRDNQLCFPMTKLILLERDLHLNKESRQVHDQNTCQQTSHINPCDEALSLAFSIPFQ